MSVPSLSHRAPLLSRRFSVESTLFSTISTDVFKVVGKDNPVPAVLLIVRGGIPVEDPAAIAFAQRIRSLTSAGLCSYTEVGVDDDNVAFVVLPQAEGASISSGRIEGVEAERRFLSAARLIARFHDAGFACGDLSPHSWWLNRSGEISLLAMCGIPVVRPDKSTYPSGAEALTWREFTAPEILAGGPATPSSDVYSLGCLGQKLLKQFMTTDRGSYLQAIFAEALTPDPLLRPVSAAMFLEQILETRTRHNEAMSMPRAAQRARVAASARGAIVALNPVAVQTAKSGSTTADKHIEDGGLPSKSNNATSSSSVGKHSQSRPLVVGVLGVLVFVSFLVGTRLATSHQKNQQERTGQEAQLEMVAGNLALEQAVRALANPETSIAERQLQVEKLTNSDDPLAHELLVKAALAAASEEQRLLAERGIVERARRLGMLRTAEQGRLYLRSMTETILPAEYEPVLRLMNANLPKQARLSFLKQVFAHDSDLATRLTAASGLDLNDPSLTTLLAQLVGERTKIDDTSGKSLLALLLADRDLSTLYGDDVVQRRDQLTLADLNWVLPILADRNDAAIRPLANFALEKGAVPPIRAVFLELMRDRSDLSSEVLAALVRASTEKSTMEDIASLGRWIDTGAERALLALCATIPPGDPRALEAFDTMAGRTGTSEPASSMVQWIRDSRWAERERFIRAVGVLSFADRLSRAELERAIPGFGNVLKEPELLEVLVRQSTPEVSSILVAKFGDKFGMGGLVNLLSHPDKEVRLAAIKGLKDVNEALVLRLIVQKYQTEKDPDVAEAYRQTFWVIRERNK